MGALDLIICALCIGIGLEFTTALPNERAAAETHDKLVLHLETFPLRALLAYESRLQAQKKESIKRHSPNTGFLQIGQKFIKPSLGMAGNKIIVSKHFGAFDKSGGGETKPEEGPPMKHSNTNGESVFPMMVSPSDDDSEIGYQPGLEGFFPSTGYEDEPVECRQNLNSWFKTCLSPTSFSQKPLVGKTVNFKRLRSFLSPNNKARMRKAALQELNAGKELGIDAASTKSRPEENDLRSTMSYAESLLAPR